MAFQALNLIKSGGQNFFAAKASSAFDKRLHDWSELGDAYAFQEPDITMLSGRRRSIGVLAGAAALLMLPSVAAAHCDSMDGPVVADAQRALSEGDFKPVLKWIRATDVDAMRKSFDMAVGVRKASANAKSLADRYFFETLVRVHRAGEGEAFDGLKAAGTVDPIFAQTDRALNQGSGDAIADQLGADVTRSIKQRFAKARALKPTAELSATQGRAYVASYVQLTHFVEATSHLVAEGASEKHSHDAARAPTNEREAVIAPQQSGSTR